MENEHLLSGEANSPLLQRKPEKSTDEEEEEKEEDDDDEEEEEEDIQPINGVGDLAREFFIESKKLWCLAGPAIFTSFCQYGLITISQIFAGHLGTTQLAALSVENNIISAFPYAIMLGMSSALETYCGQAFGANQLEMLGIYLQKTWLILIGMSIATIPLFVFAAPVLRFLGQTASISKQAGNFALWMIPQQLAYATMYPTTKFLQAQSKVMVIAVIAAFALCFHGFFTWFFVAYLEWGLIGAGVVLDGSWWFISVAQFLYILTGNCGKAWSGFSWKAFQDLWRFLKISVASAVMMCLEIWYLMAMTLFAGHLEDAEISIDALSICVNILGWACTIALGLNVASSVRVSNELGSLHPGKSRFSAFVSGVTSLLIGLIFVVVLTISREKYPALFSNSSEVQQLVHKLTPLLGISLVFTNVQYALSGVAIGAGWQAPVAYLSSACYFMIGVPLGVLMAFKFKMGIQGIWSGMVIGLSLQTCLLLGMILITNWNKECCEAEERLKQWSGETNGEEIGSSIE